MAAGTIHQLQSCGLLAEGDGWQKRNQRFSELFTDPSQWWAHRNCKVGPRYPGSMHKESLWMNGCYNPSWVAEELANRGFVLSYGELCTRNGTALPVGIQDVGAAFVALLRACTKNKDLHRGTKIHDDILKRGLLEKCSDALVTMYAKCGELDKAKTLFDMHKSRDVFTWTALISGYAREGRAYNALDCFKCMQHEGILPDAFTYACILKACGTIGAADKGKQIHDEIIRQGLLLQNDIVLGTALVDMYAKCGALAKARGVLEELPCRDVVSWSAVIAGYAQEGQGEQALNCFDRMQHEGILPDAVTYACIINACATIGASDKGEQIHQAIARQGLLQNDIVLGTALVDMYAKCGAFSKAQRVLEGLSSRDVVLWSAVIAGYAQEGQGEQALNCFECMQREGILPNAVTFLCVLNVCSHLGLVEEGHALFVNMSNKYGVKPNLECYTCMLDLLGRAGHLERAVRLIQEMPFSDYLSYDCSAIWHALLGACWKWGDVNVARWAFEQAVQVDESDGPAYVLMANIYAATGMQENAKNVEAMRIKNKAWKKLSWSIDWSKDAYPFLLEIHSMHKANVCTRS